MAYLKFSKLQVLALLTGIFTTSVYSQQKIERLDIGNDELLVRVTIPKAYDGVKSFPVLLGPGLDGDNLKNGSRFFGNNKEEHGWILVESLVHMKPRKAVGVVLNYLQDNYKIGDVYILGFSANSIDAFNIASDYHNRIDGVIGMPGNPNVQDLEKLKRLSKMKIMMIVGERDSYWKRRAESAKNVLDDQNIWNRLKVIPKGGHVLDELTGEPLFAILEELQAN
ncbi:hypothetical protein M3P19_15860 [Muricauda sp. 2012CJ35-5]|uniref:Alpha/beta hydrolase n=1 Tax=Flagellimonas spongiicola TaxID=2942208 RepID=A0ABT0PVT1_9FLAO|nr:hypothetical protein [Allomuricauda spongiicola]MCL6275490.1 hypothetical protein [Allomuricauda spongiicola]